MPKQETEKQQGLIPQINKDKDALSKLQRQFNSKINRINKLKASLADRKAQVEQVRKRVQQELKPLQDDTLNARVEFLKLLDQAYHLTLFRKREKEKLAALIEDLSFHLIEDHDREDLIPLHDKYAAFSHAEVVEQAEEQAKDMTRDMFYDFFGEEIDPDSFGGAADIEEHLRQKMEEQEQAWQAQQPKRKKTKAQLAKEEAMKAEMDNISKASRRLYTDLAKQLHPDRERDVAQRVWKEEVMKQVTAAYNQNDFFELLRLHMEFLQEKDKALGELPEEQLKYYLKLLTDQLKELEEESTFSSFGPEGTLLYQFGGTPKQMEQRFRAAKAELRRELKQLQDDLRFFKDPENIRSFLKQVR